MMTHQTESRPDQLDPQSAPPAAPARTGQEPTPANPAGNGPPLEAATLACLPVGVFVLDGQGRLTYLNARAERFFTRVANRERDQLLGLPLWESCPEIADSAFAREYERAAAERSDFELEAFYPTLGRWFALRASCAGEYRPFVLEDITARVELERTARRHAAELAEVEGGQDEFLLALAHKLRNTLVPIRNALHLT